MPEIQENNEKPKTDLFSKWSLAGIALEMGFIIALPLVVFALLGKWIDARLHTFPWITLVSIVLAVTSTSIWMYKRLKTYIK